MVTVKKTAIIHLQTELNKTCGVTRSILRIIKNSRSYEHHVISLGGDALERFEGFNYKIINANRNSIIGTLNIFFTLLAYIKKNKIQIIHAHHRYFDLVSFLLKRFVSVKTVTTVHSKVYNKKLFSYKSDKVIVVSNAIKQHIINNFNVNPSDIILMNNFVDQNEVKITQKKEEIFTGIGLNSTTRLVGYFGRLDIQEKGVDILLDALKKVKEYVPSVFLILAGNGIDEKILKESALNNNLPALFLGKIDNIWDYINTCEIVILPSRVEPFNLVMIEAGLLSKPVIGANIDGIAETLRDQVNGILFDKENIDDLTNKIIELLSDKIKMETIGRNLNGKVLNEYTSEKVIPVIEEFYSRLLLQE
jgi:glycosyltransferase involved in cell wall biosynthesis